MAMCTRASISPSSSPHKIILPWYCPWFMVLWMLAVPLWNRRSPYGKSLQPSQESFSILSMDPLHQCNAVSIIHMHITNECYTQLPTCPTCTNMLLWAHKYAHMCILQSHKFTMKQSPIHSHGSVNTFTPLPSSFLSYINTYARTKKKNLYPDVRRRCVHACHGPLMNRGTSRDGKMERGRDCRCVGCRCSREGVVDAALLLSLMGGEICHRGVKVEMSVQSPLEQRRQWTLTVW